MGEFPDERHLAELGPRFVEAMRLRERGRLDDATDALRAILRAEPRLAEPRMELARVWLETGRLDEAEAEVREALRVLEAGGQWTDELPEHVVLALAWALLGEILRERASTDEVVFGPEEAFRELIEQSRAAFSRAHALDPSDTHAGLSAQPEDDEDALPQERRARREMTGDLLDEDPDEV